MYEVDAAAFQQAVTVMQQVISLVDGRQGPPQFSEMNTKDRVSAADGLRQFQNVIEPLQVPVTQGVTRDAINAIGNDRQPLVFVACGNLMLNISNVLRNELGTRKVFCLDANRSSYYEGVNSPWGDEITKKFPSLAYEIDQAGKCYACDLSTAATFHAIRCMEAGIRAIARCLSILDPTTGKDRNWSNISRSIKDMLDKRWPASTGRMSGDAQLFDALHGAISGMQNPYRNETMHLSATYTAPEALHIMELVKGLMQKIASRMDENGDPKASP